MLLLRVRVKILIVKHGVVVKGNARYGFFGEPSFDFTTPQSLLGALRNRGDASSFFYWLGVNTRIHVFLFILFVNWRGTIWRVNDLVVRFSSKILLCWESLPHLFFDIGVLGALASLQRDSNKLLQISPLNQLIIVLIWSSSNPKYLIESNSGGGYFLSMIFHLKYVR